MNAVEIEAAVSDLAASAFDAEQFPYLFLAAFGNKDTTLRKLRAGASNASDVSGAVLQRNNIHIAACAEGRVSETFDALLASSATAKAKAKFILATDGKEFQAKDLANDEMVACAFEDFPNHFGLFLPLAGITTVREIKDNPIDVRATGRLNKLYVELLRENPDWALEDRQSDMNHFMARLIFCFFAEDTGIFNRSSLFTQTVEQISDRDGSNTHEVLEIIFRTMNIKVKDRADIVPRIPNWAIAFPYVNGGLFAGNTAVPRFTRIARTYLSYAANLNWNEINPDIFGSMIQAVADDEERGALGMHYTSVPNILKVLNPLFLDDLRAQLESAGDNKVKLLNLRKRMARIRVFDPACGSGNFLVIAYKQMREIEATINHLRAEQHKKSEIPLTNFRGIELRSFPAEVARLALIIAEFQCDVQYRGQQEAVDEFLPLNTENWIVCGNALRLDWLSICPATGSTVKVVGDDLFNTPTEQSEIEFENEGGETYICGNPPYKGSQGQTEEQKQDLERTVGAYCKNWKSLDYVTGWFIKASVYGNKNPYAAAFVTTNSICQGRQVESLWRPILAGGVEIFFAHTSFKWANLATYNAGVTVAIVGISNKSSKIRRIFSDSEDGSITVKETTNINPYLASGPSIFISAESTPISALSEMSFGSMPNDGGNLILDMLTAENAISSQSVAPSFIRPLVGAQEFIRGQERRCIWVRDTDRNSAESNPWLRSKFDLTSDIRKKSSRKTTRDLSVVPFRFGEVRQTGEEKIIIVPAVSSELREFLPVGYLAGGTIVSNSAFALYDAPLWNLSLIASRVHLVWIGTVCGKLETRFRYSNTLGWNTFPVPTLTQNNKDEMTTCAEAILLAREQHFPATIADLYDPNSMPENLRKAHERNDEAIERIYIGRRFKNDTERLDKLFELYIKMTTTAGRGRARTTQ